MVMLSGSSGERVVTSSRWTVMVPGPEPARAAMRAATRWEKSSRSTARAWPAGTAVASASLEEEGVGEAHLLLEEPGGGVEGLGLEGVGADELGEVGGLVGLGGAMRAHLVEVDFAA